MSTATQGSWLQEGVWRQEWPALANLDNGVAASLSKWPVKSIQAIGAGSVTIQGSNDGGTTWATLTSDGVTPIPALTGGAIVAPYENTELIRPGAATGVSRVIIIATG